MLQIFGQIELPPGVEQYGNLANPSSSSIRFFGLTKFISNILKLIVVGGGIFSLVNFVLAGLGYMSASGDPKKTAAAWEKIWMSLIGLLIIVSSFTIIAIISYIFFGDWTTLTRPVIYGPVN